MKEVILANVSEGKNLEKIVDHRFDLKREYCITRWTVYSEYQIISEGVNEWGNEIRKIQTTSSKDIHRIYEPLSATRNLFQEIAKINIDVEYMEIDSITRPYPCVKSEKSKKSLMNFINKFGLLGCRERKYAHKRYSEEAALRNAKLNIAEVEFDELDNYAHEIFKFKTANELLQKIGAGNAKQDHMHELAKFISQELIKYELVQVEEGIVYPSVLVPSLFDVAWMQLQEALMGNFKYKKCEKCGSYFVIPHGNQKFCPSVLKGSNSSCGAAYNKAQKRKRKKER
jgi:hypothetical protein